jgi:uncharacterized protein DUF4232
MGFRPQWSRDVTSRGMLTYRFAVLFALVVGLVAGGCNGSVASSGSSTSSSAPPVASLGASPCQASQLSVSFTNKRGRADHSYRVVLVLTNTAAFPCGMFGFVDLRMLEPDGETLITDVERANTNRRATDVVVPPSGQASAQLSWVGIESREACVAPTGLEITPPGDTRFVVVTWPVSSLVCQDGQLDIEPVHSGAPSSRRLGEVRIGSAT